MLQKVVDAVSGTRRPRIAALVASYEEEKVALDREIAELTTELSKKRSEREEVVIVLERLRG